MNKSAKQHLAKAKDYADKGEQFYRKTAEEILAAQKADPTLTQREIGETLGRGNTWVSEILSWHKGVHARETPFGGDTPANRARDRSAAKKVLRQAPPEEIAAMVADLDANKRIEISQAIDRESLKRQREREQVAESKFRNVVGDDTADGLELAQNMKDAEWWLVKGHQDAQSFLKAANRLGIENTPEHWRKSCLDWIESIESNLGMAKALLQGDDIDWTAFEDMLKEVS